MNKLTLIAIAAAAMASPVAAQSFQDLAALDSEVAARLGAKIGEPGGATAPIDRRLRLQNCPGQVEIDVPTSRYATVRCEAIGWRIRVPLSAMAGGSFTATSDAPAALASAPQPDAQPMVLRGTQVQVVVERPGFSVSSQATAMGQGALGEEIRVRLSDSRTLRTARVTGPSRAVLID